MSFNLSKEIMTKIDELRAALEIEVDDLHSEFDNKSERWQESEPGVDTSAWIEGLDNFIDDLDNFKHKPSE